MTAGPGRSSRARGWLGGAGLILAGFGLVVLLLLLFGNGAGTPVAEDADVATALRTCRRVGTGVLPEQVHESSGVARGVRNPALFWTHNDSGSDAILYAFGGEGGLAGAVGVSGAEAVDWEDIEAGPCRDSDGSCLFIADTGDNAARRDHIVVYEVPEPGPGEATVTATALRARYPDGPRDAEGLFLSGGRVHVVTKGREGPIRVYRFPEAAGAGSVATLEAVAEVAPRPATSADYVTAATTSPDGRWIALRTYRSLLLFEAGPLLEGRAGEPRRFDLRPLAEPQGEGVALGAGGEVWLTSEARGGSPPRWNRVVCEVPAP